MRDPDLWKRLEAFRFDADTGSEPYSVKLARAEGWSADYTRAVIEEYRRFLYLTQVSEGPVTPSEPVDRAWHMHLTFTRSYWDELCRKVLKGPLHHDPCAGREEMPRYEAQFDETLALYREEFGNEPPGMVWRNEDSVGTEEVFSETRQTVSALGLGIGLPGIVLSVLALMIVGIKAWTVIMAGLFLVLLAVGALAYPRRKKKADAGGCGAFAGGCGGGSRTAQSADGAADSGQVGGGGGCGGGGCGGGGG